MLTLEQLIQIKKVMKCCAYCPNQLEYVWLNRGWLSGKQKTLTGFFRCKEHQSTDDPSTNMERYYPLNEQEMFVLRIL